MMLLPSSGYFFRRTLHAGSQRSMTTPSWADTVAGTADAQGSPRILSPRILTGGRIMRRRELLVTIGTGLAIVALPIGGVAIANHVKLEGTHLPPMPPNAAPAS